MSLQKRIFKSNAVTSFLCGLVVLYIRFIYRTTRWTYVNDKLPYLASENETPVIAAAWHGRFALLPYCYKHPERVHLLISRHRDGEFITRVIEAFRFKTIRGSAAKPGKASKGGAEALRAMLGAIKNGSHVFITPDGPRGPRMRVSEGIVTLARLSGAPVLPITFATAKRKVANSWDLFVLPLPFGRGVFVYGDPIFVPKDADEELCAQKRQEIEDALIKITHEADKLMGQDQIDPAPLAKAQQNA